MHRYELLLLGGRSGVGKSTVGYEVSAQLRDAGVAHCLIEGDNLGHAFPPPPGDPDRSRLTETNLTALWGTYAGLGYRRLIYTNTVSVLESAMLTRAMGGTVRVTAVLLTADDTTAAHRLRAREIGTQLDPHLARSATMSRHLDATAPATVLRIRTDDRPVPAIAAEIVTATTWTTPTPHPLEHDR